MSEHSDNNDNVLAQENGQNSDMNTIQTSDQENVQNVQNNGNNESINENRQNNENNESEHENSFKLDFRQLYDPDYDEDVDNQSYETIQTQATELVNQINRNEFKHVMKKVSNSETKMLSFLKKFKNVETFLIYFNLLDPPQKNVKGAKKKKSENPRIDPSFLDLIDQMCIVLGDNLIYYFSDNATIKTLKEAIDKHGLEFENNKVTAVCFDAKQGYKLLKNCFDISDETLNKIFFHDVKTAMWCMDADIKEPRSIMVILEDYLKVDKLNEFTERIRDSNANRDQSALNHVILLYPIMFNLMDLLYEKKLYDNYVNIELPSIILFAKMELKGLTLDVLYLNKAIKEWNSYIKLMQNEIKSRNGGKEVNVRSPKQVQSLLAECGLYDKYIEKYAPGLSANELKTGKEILERMKDFDPLPGYILDSRKVYHLIGAAEDYIAELGEGTTVMGTYKHFLVTGRVAMKDPNLLGVDKDFVFTVNDESYRVSLKKGFKGRAGYVLVAADYSQIELRILASLSGENKLIDVFNLKQDPFKQIASKIKNKPVDDILPEERDSTKQIIYSIIYGCGITRLSENLRAESEEQTIAFLNEFHEAFPNLDPFIKRTKESCKKRGFVETLLGRRRYIPDIRSEDPTTQAYGERKAVNSRIQGSAADLIKLSMLRVTSAIERESIDADLLLQIHDELIFEVRDDKAIIDKFVKVLTKQMTEYSIVLEAKIDIKVKLGENWSELREYTPTTEI